MAEAALGAAPIDDGPDALATVRLLAARGSHAALGELVDAPEPLVRRRLSDVAWLKRLGECFCGDPGFRADFLAAPERAARARGLRVAPEDLNAFHAAQGGSDEDDPRARWTENMHALWELTRAGLDCEGWNAAAQSGARPGGEHYRRWRARCRARERYDFPPHVAGFYRPVVAVELASGCSVGCWFCAISADGLRATAELGAAERAEWHAVVDVLERTLGASSAAAICYWATDPLDNPSYESFLEAFHARTGAWPPTVTALAARQPERVARILARAARHGCLSNELSVLSVADLRRLHAAFRPEDLLFTPLVLQGRGAHQFVAYPRAVPARKVLAGRVREAAARGNAMAREAQPGSIACVVGFLLNLVERRVRLIRPCTADARWPLGYVVLDEARYADAPELEARITAMTSRWMSAELPDDRVIGFDHGLEFRVLPNGFELRGAWQTRRFVDRLRLPGRPSWLAIGVLVNAGDASASTIARRLAAGGIDAAAVSEALGVLYDAGVLALDAR